MTPPPIDSRRGGAHRFRARVLSVRSAEELIEQLARTQSDPEGVGLMALKGRTLLVRLDGVSLRAAPLLKQEWLAAGGDSAHARGIADHSVASSSVVLIGTVGEFRRALAKLRRQPFGLRAIAAEVDRAIAAVDAHGPRTLRGAHRQIPFGERPRVIGVVNVTPDSFSDGGKFLEPERAAAHARALVDEGADWIDLGGESTRPGATPVPWEVEWGRVGPVLEALGPKFPVPISIDTRHAEVARRAVELGADIVNDVSGLTDPAMRAVVRETGAAAIVMHMRGDPTTMATLTDYADVRGEVYAALADRLDDAVADGIPADRLLVDPGLGFAKTARDSLELLAHAGEFRSLGVPVVVGASRKSFLAPFTGAARPDDRLEASLAAAVVAALERVEFVRVHDVAPTVRALRLVAAILGRAA